ncbi:uncharacterized protein yc1106_09812 [Curvularia clavata]|uniref:Uncharacterized protein n=1 Tax=Curvularia clavata TaxID=95742 RepID=A0A9Q9DVS5_CURCL|nr:uncharacterized protein yc1106_09812 [Curvularia clavata]
MASKKDMRRADLIVPYAEPEKSKDEGDMSSEHSLGTLAARLVLMATSRHPLEHAAHGCFFAVQAWLAETAEQKKTSTTPAYFQVGMSSMQAPTPHTYSSLLLPPPPVRAGQGSGTEAFAAAPPS